MFDSFLSTQLQGPLLLLILLWVLPWKGVALWRAAKNSHKKWFIALLILNTLAILEIIYIFCFSKRTKLANGSEADSKNKKATFDRD